jgi:L-serine dehydratase
VQADDHKLAQAFLISAAIGIVIGNRASFSGAVGGCQSEIGIAAGMAAAGAAWLASGSTEAVVHAAALSLKNILGLTCDPPASPVEVPCIKRNGMGTAVAFMGAEMALAGLRSTVTPDDVVAALADTQRRLPCELKGSCGGLASTQSAERMRQAWLEKLKTMQ